MAQQEQTPIYRLTSEAFKGECFFKYNEKGILTSYRYNANMGAEGLTWLSVNFPTMKILLKRLESKMSKIEEITVEDFRRYSAVFKNT